MGGNDFSNTGAGPTARDAFSSLVREAQYDSGHGGYSGTIAEKSSFTMKTKKPDETVRELIDRTIEDNDKWGPAFCCSLGTVAEYNAAKLAENPNARPRFAHAKPTDGVWIFWGIASS